MKKLLKNKKGFTLIELIVVIAILAILAAILIPAITNYITEAEDARDDANARTKYTEAALAISTADTWTHNAPCTEVNAITDIADFSCTIDGDTYTPASFE